MSKTKIENSQHRHTLQKLYCQARGCAKFRFAASVLDETLHRRDSWLNLVARPFATGLFASELGLVRALGKCTTAREVRAEYCARRDSAMTAGQWLQARLRFRISGERLMRLAKEMFEGAPGLLDPKTPF
jgi:hypothetical protein